MRLLRYLLVSGSAALLAGALTLIAGTGGTVPGHASHAAYPAPLISAARASLARYLRHYHPQAMLAGHARAGRNGITASPSFNWSGYADGASTTPAGTFTAVSGAWTAPSVTCSAEDQITVDWVGLDGMFSIGGDEHDDRRPLERGQEVEAVAAAQLDVEEHQVGLCLANGGDRLLDRLRLAHDLDPGMVGQQPAHRLARQVLVVDDQDPHGSPSSTSVATTLGSGPPCSRKLNWCRPG